MKKYFCILLAIIVLKSLSFAGTYLIEGAKLKTVSSTTGNENAFWVKFEGGTGECAGQEKIYFYAEDAGHPEIFKRTYGAAITALINQIPVDIYRYEGSGCRGVSINLHRSE